MPRNSYGYIWLAILTNFSMSYARRRIMTIKKIGNALYIDGDHPIEDAKFYASLLKSPELGLTARQIKAVREGKSVSIKLIVDEVKDEKDD
jgi:hypothetical protein